MIIYLQSISLPEEMRMTHVPALKSGFNILSHPPSAQYSSNIRGRSHRAVEHIKFSR